MWSFDANPGLPQAFPVRPPILPKVGKTGRFPEPRVWREVGNISPRIETWWKVMTSGPPMALAKFAKLIRRNRRISNGYVEHNSAWALPHGVPTMRCPAAAGATTGQAGGHTGRRPGRPGARGGGAVGDNGAGGRGQGCPRSTPQEAPGPTPAPRRTAEPPPRPSPPGERVQPARRGTPRARGAPPPSPPTRWASAPRSPPRATVEARGPPAGAASPRPRSAPASSATRPRSLRHWPRGPPA